MPKVYRVITGDTDCTVPLCSEAMIMGRSQGNWVLHLRLSLIYLFIYFTHFDKSTVKKGKNREKKKKIKKKKRKKGKAKVTCAK